MTMKEAAQILAILKAAYPNSYKNMAKEEAAATTTVWAMQFRKEPAEIVYMAINRLIATSLFPPAISEVKKAIDGMFWEAHEALTVDYKRQALTEKQESLYQWLVDNHKVRIEPTLWELSDGLNQYLLTGGE